MSQQNMRTNFFLILTLAVALPSIAQPQFPRNAEGRIEFTKIIQLDSASKASHFSKAKLWIANTFRSAQDVIQYESIEEGKILCKGSFQITPTGMGANGTIHRTQAGSVRFTMEISIKETKCRIRSYDFTHEAEYGGGSFENIKPACGGMFMYAKTWDSIRLQATEKMNSGFADFEKSMTEAKKDDF